MIDRNKLFYSVCYSVVTVCIVPVAVYQICFALFFSYLRHLELTTYHERRGVSTYRLYDQASSLAIKVYVASVCQHLVFVFRFHSFKFHLMQRKDYYIA